MHLLIVTTGIIVVTVFVEIGHSNVGIDVTPTSIHVPPANAPHTAPCQGT